MESLVDLTFGEIFLIAFKVIPAWLLASASWVLALVFAILFFIGIGKIVVITWGYLSEKLEELIDDKNS